jgi:hypothetical protein
MARMMPIDSDAIRLAGYKYNASLNPVYLPGRYNNFFKPRDIHFKNGVVQLPASAVPYIRVPLFWLSFHNFPLWFYSMLCKTTMKHDKYLCLYFHPWEFTPLENPDFGFPKYVTRNSGQLMIDRLSSLIFWMKNMNYSFSTISNFLESRNDLKDHVF